MLKKKKLIIIKLLKNMKKKQKNIKPILLYSRQSVILPEFNGLIVKIYNGKRFIEREITEDMIGIKFGELSLTCVVGYSKITEEKDKRKK